MFQTKDVGRKIAAKRKEKDMTQMELADAMGVSFQAVSNWERGNSMPDIGKLPELAAVLDLSIDELLNDEKPARLVQHILDGSESAYIHQEGIRPDTVADVAPILKPKQTESLLEDVLSDGELEISDLVSIAPFVSGEFLDEWVLKISTVDNIKALSNVAPFLSEESLDHLADKLSKEAVNVRDLLPLAPFLSEEALDKIVRGASGTGDVPIRSLTSLAPFLSGESLDWLATSALQNASPKDIVPLAPFLSKETLQRCANSLISRYGVEGIKEISPFL